MEDTITTKNHKIKSCKYTYQTRKQRLVFNYQR